MRRPAEQRARLVQEWVDLQAAGKSGHGAAESLGVAQACLYRWHQAIERGGIEALAYRKPTGRPRKARKEGAE